jgi:thioesterase-3
LPHRTSIKIRGYHCDAYGHVNNARYLELLEEARWQYLVDGLGLNYWSDRGLGFVVAEIRLVYKRPLNPESVVEIVSETTRLEGRKGVIHQVIHDMTRDKVAAEADIIFAVIDLQTGRAREMAGEVKAGFDTIREKLDGVEA